MPGAHTKERLFQEAVRLFSKLKLDMAVSGKQPETTDCAYEVNNSRAP